LCEPLEGTEGLIETVGTLLRRRRIVVKNKRECQQGVSSIHTLHSIEIRH